MGSDDANGAVQAGEALQAALADLDRASGGDTFSSLLLNLGKCLGGMTIDENRDRLAQSLRSGTLRAGYITTLRDALDNALRESGKEIE